MRTRRRAWMGISLVLGIVTSPVLAETLTQRVERMERELNELKMELRRRDEAEDRRAAEAAKAVPPAPAATTAGVEAAPAAGAGSSTSAAALQAITDRVKIGGYGSVRYEGSSLQEQKNTFTFRRFVLTADANIAARLKAYMELEFERFRELELEKETTTEDGGFGAEQTVEGTDGSEIAFEQAWLQYDIADDWFQLRAGEVLVPLGRFNLNHDDNRWDIARRSLVDRGVPVLPVSAAWGELGVGFLGSLPLGRRGLLDYQAYVVNGAVLDVEFEQIARSRVGDTTLSETEVKVQPSTGTFGSDVKDAKAITGRLAWSPALGHEVATSGYFGQYTPDFLGKEDLWAAALDGRTGWGPFELEGEYVYTRFEGIGNVARQLARQAIEQESVNESAELENEVSFELSGLAHAKQGYWLEGRYRFWPRWLTDTVLGRHFDHPQLVAVVRGEQVWLNDTVEEVNFSRGRLTAFDTDDRWLSRITAGLAYRPVPLVVFQLAYEFTLTNPDESLAGVTNFMPAGPHEDHAHTVLVGAAFGF